jgi:predicted deacylase
MYREVSDLQILNHRLVEKTAYQTPYYVIRGNSNGPTVMITAGVHGNERANVQAIKTWLSLFQKRILHITNGTLVIVPLVNQNAYQLCIRGVPDLNRTFPRVAGGTARHPLSAALFRLAARFKPMWYIDLHEANGLSKIQPRVLGQTLITNPTSTAIPAVKRIIGLMNRSIPQPTKHFTIRLHELPGSGRTAAARLLHCRSITVETSYHLPFADRVRYQMKILRRVLYETGLIKAPAKAAKKEVTSP